MELYDIRQALLEITSLRKQVDINEEDWTFFYKRPLNPILKEVEAKRASLQHELKIFYVAWDSVNTCFVLVPKSDGSMP